MPCRLQERQLVAQGLHLLHSRDTSPDVEVSAAELDADPVLANVALMQHRSNEDTAPAAGSQEAQDAAEAVVHLDLPAVAYLLRHHPDESIREQVYEMAVEPRGLKALQLLEQLSHVRSKIAK